MLTEKRVTVGRGQFHVQSVTNRKGEPNPHPKAGQPYDTASFDDLHARMGNPVVCAKSDAPWMLASAYNGCDARIFGVQEKEGLYAYLLGDVDKGNSSLEQVKAAVRAVLPGTRALINSTSSAAETDTRWHITVPVDVLMPYRAFLPFQTVFFRALEAQGLQMDWALTRSAQLFYLPSKVQADSYYQCADLPGIAYTAAHGAGPLCALAREEYVKLEQDKARAASHARRGTNDRHSIIHWVNRNFVTEDLLEQYGYSFDGKEWASPQQQESGPKHSTMVRPDGSWFSFSSSDNDAGVGKSAGQGRNGDAFDIVRHYAFGGDLDKTLDWAKQARSTAFAADPAMQSVRRFVDNLAKGNN